MKKITFFIIFVLAFGTVFSQDSDQIKKKWFFSGGGGIQISGYKKVDFVRENVAPSFLISTGIWLSPSIAIQANYKGYYFHTISDKDKHHFYFFFVEAKANFKKLFWPKSKEYKLLILPHFGAGYFYNQYYKEPNFCSNIGLSTSQKIYSNFDIFLDISAVIGWDIYQGDEDILPTVIVGLNYNFN